MASLSTAAGTYNPKNFNDTYLDLQTIHYRRYNDEVQDLDVPRLWQVPRENSSEFYFGKRLDNFHKRKNAGELLPMTEYKCMKHSLTLGGPSEINYGFFNQPLGEERRYNFRWTDGRSIPLNFHQVPMWTTWQNRIDNIIKDDLGVNPSVFTQRAAAKLYGRGWDGLTFLAEFHQVVRMFRGAAGQFIELIKQYIGYKRRHLGSADTPLKTFNQWLATRYGWRILLYDIEDINKLVDEIDKEALTRTKERVGQSFTHTVDNSYSRSLGVIYDVSDITEYDISVRGSIIADFMPSKVQLNPVVTTWELIPYSFVVDWFISIGTALEALSFLALNNLYTASYGYHVTATRNVSVGTISYDPSWVNPWHAGLNEYTVKEEVEYKFRQPVSVSAIPSVRINLDWLKVTDLIALIGQSLINLSRR